MAAADPGKGQFSRFVLASSEYIACSSPVRCFSRCLFGVQPEAAILSDIVEIKGENARCSRGVGFPVDRGLNLLCKPNEMINLAVS